MGAVASKSEAEQISGRAENEIKHAKTERTKAEHVSAMGVTEIMQAKLEQKQAEQLMLKTNNEVKQANIAEAKAEQAKASMEHEVELADAEKMRAEHVAANAVKKLNNADSAERSMTFGLVGLSMVVLLLVVAVAFLKKQLSDMEQSLAQPLLDVAEAEQEPPILKKFEGKWRTEDGKLVQIDGDKMVHDDGRHEPIADLEEQILYTHRMSIKKGWLTESPVVRGSSGKVEEDGRITWHDGRVWVKADGVDDQKFGA